MSTRRLFAWLCAACVAWQGGDARGLESGRGPIASSTQIWGEADGLPGSYVLALAQTNDGYLWVGTRSGLARFDGVRFTVFDAQRTDALGNDRIEALLAARDGSLWIGSGDGLIRYERGRFVRVQGFGGPVFALAEAEAGSVWVGTPAGLARAGRNGREEVVVASDGIELSFVRTLLPAADRLWIGARQGLFELRGGKRRRVVGPEVPGDRLTIRALAADADGVLWAGIQGGWLMRVAGDERDRASIDLGPERAVYALKRDRHGNLWAATSTGLVRWQPGAARRFAQAEGLCDPRVTTLLEDREGHLWVGTMNGLQILRDGPFATVTRADGLPSDELTVAHRAPDGRLFVGTTDAGVFVWDGAVVERLTVADGLGPGAVKAIASEADGTLLVTTAAGITEVSPGRLRFVATADWQRRPLHASVPAHDGGLWVALGGGTLKRFRGGAFGDVDPLIARTLEASPIFEDREGALWLVLPDGALGRFRAGALERIDAPVREVRSFFQDSEDRVWVGMQDAIAFRVAGGWRLWSPREHLPLRNVSQWIESEDWLWIAGVNGVSKIALAEFRAVAIRQLVAPSFVRFGPADGLRSLEFSRFPGSAGGPDGRLYFATRGGLAIADPRFRPARDAPLQVTVERIELDGVAHAPPSGGALVVPRGEGVLTVTFTAPSFREPARIRFRHQLVGLDPGFRDTGPNRAVSYANLKAGRYTLLVQAADDARPWTGDGAVVQLELVPRVFETTWFRALLASALTAIVAAFAWLRIQSRRRREEARLAERQRIARDLHDHLDQSLFAAGLQLELAAGELPAEAPARAHLELTRSLLGRFQEDARRSIANLRSQALDEAKGDFREALRLALAPSFEGGEASLKLESGPVPAWLSRAAQHELLYVARELVTNALRHGRATRVEVRVDADPGEVSLRVSDDGCGFDPARVADRHQGRFGLVGVRERLRWLGGTLTLQSEPGKGTDARARVPRDAHLRAGRS